MPRKNWIGEHISDQTGRIAAVTGASAGRGAEIARILAVKGARMIIAVRNRNAARRLRPRHAARRRLRPQGIHPDECCPIKVATLARLRDQSIAKPLWTISEDLTGVSH